MNVAFGIHQNIMVVSHFLQIIQTKAKSSTRTGMEGGG